MPARRRNRLASAAFADWFSGRFLVGSVFPDVDMLFHYLIDHGRHNHHLYWTHLPFAWLAFYGVALAAALGARRRDRAVFITSFVAGVFLHLLLDTPMGGIAWLYLASTHLYCWITIPAAYSWWVWSFLFHWTFLSELVICSLALFLFLKRRARARE